MVVWVTLFSPFVATIAIVLFAMRSPKLASSLALGGMLVSLAASVWLFWFHSQNTLLPAENGWTWIQMAGLKVEFGYLLDRLSLLMLLVVTGVGSCIFLYSIGYMHGDESYPRYFASLSLFAFSMLGIVLANNFLMLFVFWELVALSSYLLIGFWFEKPAAADAGNKAFIVNRLGDFGFVLGIFYIWMLSGVGGERTFQFSELSRLWPHAQAQGLISTGMMTLAALLVFCGVAGKSAQFPLYIWLPDAMEGPTPVSALIHAATMVAAGVYLLSRSFFLVADLPTALEVIAIIGSLTAFLAALLAMVQNDIKKILAYSTISQLGTMVMALGLGSSEAAMFHLTTHAFFKALLFLGAGAIIHALHTQDIREMGGLLKQMPLVAVTFLIGALALCGVPPLSGFWSKDEILLLAFEHNKLIYVTALFTAMLTAFYMARAVWIAVLGPKRAHKHEHVHETPWVMKAPLLALAFFSIVAGFIDIPEFLMGGHTHHTLNIAVARMSVVAAFLGLGLGTLVYAKSRAKTDPLQNALGGFHTFLIQKYYLDDFFLALARFFDSLVARVLFWFDSNMVIRTLVNGSAALTRGAGSILRKSQTGQLQTYAMTFGFGVVALVAFWMMQ